MTSSEFRAEHSGFCRWTSHLSAKFAIYTPWKFNTASEILPCQKESSPPTIIFRGLCWTSVCECKLQYIENIACNVYIYIFILMYIHISSTSFKTSILYKTHPVASPPKHRGRIIPAGDWRCRWRSPWRSWSWQRNCNFQWYYRPPAGGKQGLFKSPKIGGIKRYKSMVRQPCICLVSSRCQFVHGNLWRIRPWCIQGMHRNDGITCFSWGASARWCRTVGVLPGESFGMEVRK